ncbi:type IIL restriction-modification enzyme MmeI, partial [Planktothrix sp.]|uniref:type IIL restriction-modification enzyme MmeI n=1 Tax=Planktothrix sp. TaxID=3088171 RepID=UPI0038D514B0
QEVSLINSSLQSTIKVTQAVRLKANLNQCFQGVIPIGMGFIIDEYTVKEWIKQDSKNQEILKLFSMGANLAKNPLGKPERWIIDFNEMSLEEASNYQLPFTHIKQNVKPEREQNRAKRARDYWWQLFATRPAMRKAIANLSCCFAVPEVSKWAIFIPVSTEWLSGNKTKVVATEDYYILGILLSQVHRIWMNAQKSTLEDRTAYTHNTCFETFPFPQNPSKKIVETIRKTAIDLHEYRSQEMEKKGWGITQLYNQYYHEPASKLYKLHQKLDQL